MDVLFYVAGGVAVASAAMTVSRSNAVHALLYLVVSLLSTGLIFFLFGAPLAGVLEVIVYAGAVMVLFVFVVMMMGVAGSKESDKAGSGQGGWMGPALLALILAVEVVYAVGWGAGEASSAAMIGPHEVSASLFGPYILGVEIGSTLLLSGMVGAFHLAGKINSKGKEGG